MLVDGLDEIPDTDTRSALMAKPANVSARSEGPYRFVAATQPLPAQEVSKPGERSARRGGDTELVAESAAAFCGGGRGAEAGKPGLVGLGEALGSIVVTLFPR
ncbi:hypothetical protein [Streptomyces siamensis]|uniref:Uncharacterized protein n=1 Tax=Streptomyces siamensis TaxID=1274986 RepID=A0ABP9JIU4_9ACTN